MALLVLLLIVYDKHLGAWSITGLLLCFAVPAVVLAPVAGRLVDSMPFRTLAVVTAAWQAVCCGALAFAGPLWSVYALVLALQAGNVVAMPAWQALIPAVAEPDEVGRTVGASQAMNTVAAVAAPAVAGLTVGSLGYAVPLLIDGGTFVVLGAAGVAIRTRRSAREAGDAEPGNSLGAGRFSLRADALLWPLIVGLCVIVLVGEVTNVVEVFLVRGTLGASPTAFGLVGGVLALALVAGSILAGRTASDETRARRAAVAALVLALGLVFGGLAPTLLVFAAAWVLVGASNGIVNVDVSTLLLARTPEFCRGRVLARVSGMIRASSLGAMALGGAAGSLLGPRVTFVAGGTLMAAAAAGLVARQRRVGPEGVVPAESQGG